MANDASILDLTGMGMDEVLPEVILPKGTEVEVRITNVNKDTDKNGNDYIMPYFEVINHEDADSIPEFSDYIPLPDSEATVKENNKRKNKINGFLQAFGVDSLRLNLQELKGLTGFVIVGYRESDDYGAQNTVRKYVTGA